MTNELQVCELKVFEFKGHDVRTIMRDGHPWWVAKDVCDVLELDNRETPRKLDDDEVGKTHITDSTGRDQEMSIISEPGLYSLILRERKITTVGVPSIPRGVPRSIVRSGPPCFIFAVVDKVLALKHKARNGPFWCV